MLAKSLALAAALVSPALNLSYLDFGLGEQQFEVSVGSGAGGLQAMGWMGQGGKLDSSGSPHCSYGVSSDGGRTWSAPIFHRANGYDVGVNPVEAVTEDGTVYAFCLSGTQDPKNMSSVIEVSKSTDRGKTWSGWTKVVGRQGGIVDLPSVAVGSKGELDMVYTDMTWLSDKQSWTSRVKFMSSLDGGATWSSPVEINPDVTQSSEQGASIALDRSGAILISWTVYDKGPIYFSKSLDGGKSFTAPVTVGTSSLDPPVTRIATGAPSGALAVLVYQAHAPDGIVTLFTSRDGGARWSPGEVISRNGTRGAVLYDQDDRLEVTWSDFVDVKFDSDKGVYLAGTVVQDRYMELNAMGDTLVPASALGCQYTVKNDIPYPGAFQAMVSSSKTGELQAFMVDWSENSRILRKSWPASELPGDASACPVAVGLQSQVKARGFNFFPANPSRARRQPRSPISIEIRLN